MDEAKTDYKLTVPNVRRIQGFVAGSASFDSCLLRGQRLKFLAKFRSEPKRKGTHQGRYYANKKLAYRVRAQIYWPCESAFAHQPSAALAVGCMAFTSGRNGE